VDNFTYEYLPWRGVSKETMQFYGVKTKIDKDGKPISLSFDYPNSASKVRLLDRKEFYSVGEIGKAGLFGRDKFDPLAHKSITITEGELDALSAYQILGTPCVSISGASSGVRDCSRDFAWLRSYEKVYLCLDSDAPGRECAAGIARMFDAGQVFDVLRLSKRKDANEYLQAGEETEFRSMWYSARKYLPETIVSSLSDFQTLLEVEPEQGVPYYSFPKLTELTYGIRRGETVLVTAQEGVGKTEFLHAVEHGILRNSEWNIGGFFLEEPPKRHLQALAGIELRRPVHLPDSGCNVAEVTSAVRTVLEKDDRLFLDSQFGGVDLEHLLGDVRYLVTGCNCSCIILDHVSLGAALGEADTERKNLDNFFTKAETMVKELDFSFIIVSHVNDFGQTRGSRWGGKMADIRIDLARDVANGSNVLDIFVSKNRFAGRTGHAGSYTFDPYSRSYSMVNSGANDNEPEDKSDEARAA
jgi:twinkle protein